MVRRGDIWWVDFGEPHGSAPAYRRPALIVQADVFNAKQLRTVIVAAVTSNMRLANMPGNVLAAKSVTGLDRESIVNVTQLQTVDEADLVELAGRLDLRTMRLVDEGLQLVLQLNERR